MLPQEYNIQQTEQKWQANWQDQGVYHFDKTQGRENSYVIDTPPPTVSGLLHMGHIFSYTQADFVARFQRMYGKTVFYPMGFDDNGLPTERLVEKVKGIKAADLKRSEFITICQEVVNESEEEFRRLFKSVALSVDWRYEYQTISARSRKLSQMSFIDLLEKGRAERRKAPTFWDPVDRTAIAQAEIEDKERQSQMNYINFAIDGGGEVQIATTRPEMIGACVAVLYHPDDERYRDLKGKFALTPIFGARVPFIADDEVAIDKGTGVVMCCTFGDIQDIAWWRKHRLDLKEVIELSGKMKNSMHLDGLYVKEARAKIIAELQELNLLVKQEAITQVVKCAERSGAPLEIITTDQWYIRIMDAKEQIIEKARQCSWFPEYMRTRLEIWTNGLNQDWCISRQRYFGVPFPLWYSKRAGEEGRVLLPKLEQLPVDPMVDLPEGYTRDEVTPDSDVMDTWATSAISPQLNSLAITKDYAIDHEFHQLIYPADLRPQAHEIIRTWAFYTIVKSLFHENSIPWKNVMISGWCLAADKTKMSKSKGNVVTPTDLIIEKGADVVRYWASTSKLGVDIAYSEELFKIGKKLLNKLWNASKFAASHLEKLSGKPISPAADVASGKIFATLDLWLLSKLHEAIEKATNSFISNEYADARSAVEDFFWNDFCDNYLEMVKGRVYAEEDGRDKQSSLHTIYHVLHSLFRLFAPVMPHLTEELNHHIFGGVSVHSQGSWPKLSDHTHSPQAKIHGQNSKELLELIRKYKSNNALSLKTPLQEVTYYGEPIDGSALADIRFAANADVIVRADHGVGEVTIEGNKYSVSASCQDLTQS